ncbi:hypothetical protein N4758_23640, partial [Escherichia coli]|nr:hypothetical protein [Escherichia coli]MCU7031306.1 hypothetical protein [Escherichia coli]MCU7059708.1 hypothetical protein [Escherichia coli]
DRNRSHWSTSKTPSYTKSVSWQHHLKPDNVLDKFWPQMTSERIISRSTYHDGTQERSELVEILSDIVSMTR